MSRQIYNRLLAEKLITEFEKRDFEGYYCETKEDSLDMILQMIPKGSFVSCDGSKTLQDISLRQALCNNGYNFLDPNIAQGGAEKDRLTHISLGADYYLMSSNAITLNGELVNMDGYGSRISAYLFGPKNVIIVAGLNKVVRDVDHAIDRVKNYASQMRMLMLYQYFSSFDDLTNASKNIGGNLIISGMSSTKGRIKIILVGEPLGN